MKACCAYHGTPATLGKTVITIGIIINWRPQSNIQIIILFAGISWAVFALAYEFAPLLGSSWFLFCITELNLHQTAIGTLSNGYYRYASEHNKNKSASRSRYRSCSTISRRKLSVNLYWKRKDYRVFEKSR